MGVSLHWTRPPAHHNCIIAQNHSWREAIYERECLPGLQELGESIVKIKTSTLIWFGILLWCLFMGITAISMGLGSLFPSMNLIVRPFVCPNGQAEVDSQSYQISPVETVTTLTWYCVDEASGARTKLNPLVINLYAGLIYGSLLFVVILVAWYFYRKWDPSKASERVRQRVAWLQSTFVIALIACMILFGLMPLFRFTSVEATATPDVAATSIALTFQAMSGGTPVAFTSTEKPLASWNGIPVMREALAGHEVDHDHYSFQVFVDSETIESFYKDTLPSQGWALVESRWLGMEFTRDGHILLVTMAPASDLQSWVVTLTLVS